MELKLELYLGLIDSIPFGKKELKAMKYMKIVGYPLMISRK